uniref:hypothetical protein n=1 Tax=Pseudomonas viridiflava TaxID=33069 RepID=UPI0019D30430
MMVQADQPPSINHGQFALGSFSLNQTLKSLYLPLAIWNKQSAQALAQPHPSATRVARNFTKLT